jgi:antitoxin YefM
MVSAIKQYGVVDKAGNVQVSADLPEGTKVEIIILVEAQDETEYLLSTLANRQYLTESLAEIENRQSYIYVDLEKL